MQCARCRYLLWELREPRCPECGAAFDITDFAFPEGAVHFLCPDCGQPYLGTDDQGLPKPRQFDCIRCHRPLSADRMSVRPAVPDAVGEPLRVGTAWEHRHRLGWHRAFADSIARLAIHPADFFRRCVTTDPYGAIVFSILCAYLGAAAFLGVACLLRSFGLGGAWGVQRLLDVKALFLAAVLIPAALVMWNYLYGGLIHGVLRCLGQRRAELDRSVHAVAFAAAVLPALAFVPPVGLLWYVCIVRSGVEHLQQTSAARAWVATVLPMLLGANVVLAAGVLWL